MATPTYLITKSDFAPYIDVAANLSDAKLNPRIWEAQQFDLKELMGDTFYFDLIGNSTDSKYQDLINGGSYVAKDVTYLYDGLKPVLVYFTAARLVRHLDLHITPNAIMTKRNDFSDHVDNKAIANKVTEYQNQAIAYWEDTRKFVVNRGKTIYPLYTGFGCNEETRAFSPKTYGVRGKDTQEQYYNPRTWQSR